MHYWLFKTEPQEFSIQDLASAKNKTTRWDGIRNYQARNFIRDQIHQGDEVLIYHSQSKPNAIVGAARVVAAPYNDPAQFDPESKYFDIKSTPDKPRWFCVDIQLIKIFARPLALETVKRDERLEGMVLLKQGRLSIQPVSENEYSLIRRLTES